MNKQKQVWEDLAKENMKYYINSDYGKKITDSQFIGSGFRDYKRLIDEDGLVPKKGKILEIGCGNGRMTEFISYSYDLVIGVDISGEMIKKARARLNKHDNIEFYETDGYTLPVPDASVDVAFSYIVFQHFKTEEMVNKNFDEVYRVLKSKGIFKVLVRTDEVDLNKWWGGVKADETYPLSIGFNLLKKVQIKDYGLWLWLEK